jgi:hypothetical protein
MILRDSYQEVTFIMCFDSILGWKIERPVEGLSVNEERYEQNTNPNPRLE